MIRTLTLEAASYAGSGLCARTEPVRITLKRVKRVTVTRDVPPGSELVAGTDGSLFVNISCPAPVNGVQVSVTSSVPAAFRVPANVLRIPEGQMRAKVDFTTAAGARGQVDVRASADGHQDGLLTYHLVPSPEELCQEFEGRSGAWSQEHASWSNWGGYRFP